jgi:WS/DGAT/MGAT family acyltransferase
MTGAEALMWAVQRDPILRSSFLNLSLLEQAPDFARFRRRMAQAVDALPRLHQRVRGAAIPGTWPEWVDDTSFDLDYHVRHVALPPPGTMRQLLDLAAVEAQDSFDLARPLWTFWVIEGLEGDKAALLSKMHHTITDGVGGVRLSAQFVDLAPDAPNPEPAPPAEVVGGGNPLVAAARQVGDAVGSVARVAGSLATARPGAAVETARSFVRQVVVTESAHSPLWAGRHGLGRAFEVLSFSLDEAKEAAHTLGGTVNDLFVAGVAGGAAAYHRAKGADVDELRMTMPVSTRSDRSAGGNAFAPARVLIPAGTVDPAKRFALVHERLSATRSERALGWAGALAGALTALPDPLLVRMARSQVDTVDFATSNVRGAPFDLWIAGARILANHPFGPTAGTAFNATVLSSAGSMDVGLACDTAAIDDPDLLRRCVEDGIAEVIAAGS